MSSKQKKPKFDVVQIKLYFSKLKNPRQFMPGVIVARAGVEPTSKGYEPFELPPSLSRNVYKLTRKVWRQLNWNYNFRSSHPN